MRTAVAVTAAGDLTFAAAFVTTTHNESPVVIEASLD
jgi:hypothetical protein